jgi:2-polyprenyl-6-methoxyphenol hydroxylase-like FAD-dependent oxidoreductase
VAYRIPRTEGGGPMNSDLVNWVLYASAGPDGFGAACAALPAAWEALIRASVSTTRAIGDLRLSRSTAGGILLVGDAATVTRPHTASGATKALEDAFALHDAVTRRATWAEAADAFDARRTPAGNALVDLGRRLGHDQVERTPEWSTMDEQAMQSWAAATLAGGSNYLYTAE